MTAAISTSSTSKNTGPAENAGPFAIGRTAMKKTMVAIGLAALLLNAASATAQTGDWKKTWDETLAAARKEGKVTVVGSPDPVMRNEVIPAFEKRYPGIKVDYLAGRSADLVERIKLERGSGIYSTDVYLSGPDTQYNI